ncbi:MAG: alpha/beta hydrolase [Deltaproteobacteria bacterium]|nr:alpha/beta hydrolase [Deltaproteobacteria bacterium]
MSRAGTLLVMTRLWLLVASGCSDLVYRFGIPLFYEEAELPASQVLLDLPYRTDAGADPVKHRLDLFLPTPAEAPAPVLVFVHGGGWRVGDKSYAPGGHDVYGNIGRYFASRGVATAVIGYRLMPRVRLEEQIDDVAHAVAWLHREVARYGLDPDRLFLAGHSAGAQLATWVALDPGRLAGVGVPERSIRGLVAVSGAAYDVADEETYRLGGDPEYYAERFRNGHADDAWKSAASPIRFARADAPPALIFYADGESEALKHQARLLTDALTRAGASARLVAVPAGSHERIVLTLSRDDRVAGPAMLAFIRSADGTSRRSRAP